MGSFSNYLENALLKHVFNGTAYSAPAAVYVALSTADPLDDGSALAEPSGNGYARTQVASWSTASAGQVSNAAQVQFPQATGAWGTITHFALLDAASGGNLLAHAPLAAALSVQTGNAPLFDVGGIVVSLD
jgi:hypothetical protein